MKIFETNVIIEGYELYSTSSNTNRGGTSIYAKSIFNIAERSDLNILHNDFESIWIEIKNITRDFIHRE